MPWSPNPPALALVSKTVTATPLRRSSAAQASPAGPAPMTATLADTDGPGAKNGSPLAASVSMAWRCRRPIEIGVSSAARTQAPSHRRSTGQAAAQVPPRGLAARIVRALPSTLPVAILRMKDGTSMPVGQARAHGASKQ